MSAEPTISDILNAVNDFSSNTERRFDNVDKRLNKIEAIMVDKDYLDDKLADLRGDLVVLMRKEDRKLLSLVNVLRKREVISGDEAASILSLEPFPQLVLNDSGK